MLHILNKRRENAKSVPIFGAVVPMFVGALNNKDKEEEDDNEGSETEEEKKNPFGFLKIFDTKLGKKNDQYHPHLLPQTLFKFGMSTININVHAYGEYEGDSGMFTTAPVLRHALYANAIADGVANFATGILYASYTQSKDFIGQVKQGELSQHEFLGALIGIFIQGGVYAFYGALAVPTIFFKLTTINKNSKDPKNSKDTKDKSKK
ncbi:hypothetical protein DSO57_1020352 [Entomophthora muscae]|uniref:Uncharacterized protein n=1 Tax=Entomophthora muscae TaxID=34485 RepID=A0ACC2U1K4_9FUNG|nr:hypothetical protein DSO57_1020352 [Entomophthora muscae]